MGRTKSFLRWAGSKQKLLPLLSCYWNENFSRYIEPFMGSAQLFFALDTEEAVLGDLNLELIEVFTQLKKNPYPIYKILTQLPISEKDYYQIRSINPKYLGKNQRAARFIYLNRLCFNGLYRTNNSGFFNVPYSGAKPENICDINLLKKAAKKLSSARIVHGDFEEVVYNNVKRNDFVYLDPPYAVENVRIFNQYGPQTFGTNDLKRLKNVLHFIEKKEAKFLLSYAYCGEAVELFKQWKQCKTSTQRNIAGFAQYRRIETELLVTNIEKITSE